jgi:signal transduction histidine kinase
MLGELLASIAHDIKQPIAGAITNANAGLRWLKRDQPDLEEVRQAVERVKRDGSRANEIIDRLRALYKKTPPKRELVDINEIISEMVAMLRGEANRFAISIRTDLAADPPKITADRVQLQQVLMNLMLNGIEAMRDTGGVLTIKSQPEDGSVLISVSDTGVGLPPEKPEKIFEAFFTTKPQGSGMGLAISRSIVESHHGRLWATPNDGRGASFHFSLPTVTEGAVRADAEAD